MLRGYRRMSWEPELDELARREALARAMGGEERVARQHASGRRTVRERIERLFDPGTFHETGALAGVGAYDDEGELSGFTPANMVCGQGEIEGRPLSSKATTSRSAAAPPTPRSGRRWSTPSGWRTTCGCRSCGSSTARRSR
jgi:acetyl-CoA carboxylase carboxyltransferase component